MKTGNKRLNTIHWEIHTDLGMENYFKHFKILTYQFHLEAEMLC